MPTDRQLSTTATLVDGADAALRILVPEDYDAVVSLAVCLSAEERYLRFFTMHPAHIGDWALSLTKPEHGIVALGAFESGELIGVANYAELTRPGECEIVIFGQGCIQVPRWRRDLAGERSRRHAPYRTDRHPPDEP